MYAFTSDVFLTGHYYILDHRREILPKLIRFFIPLPLPSFLPSCPHPTPSCPPRSLLLLQPASEWRERGWPGGEGNIGNGRGICSCVCLYKNAFSDEGSLQSKVFAEEAYCSATSLRRLVTRWIQPVRVARGSFRGNFDKFPSLVFLL